MRKLIPTCICAMSVVLASGEMASAASPSEPKPASRENAQRQPTGHYIVQASSLDAARRAVRHVGASPGKDLTIIHAVTADLTSAQADRLETGRDAHVFLDRAVSPESNSGKGSSALQPSPSSALNPPLTTALNIEAQAAPLIDGGPLNVLPGLYVTSYPVQVGATLLQQQGINGKGITIAVLDTGIWTGGGQNFASRIIGSVDIVAGGTQPVTSDPYGHGTHIASIAAGGASTAMGTSFGVAPAANLVVVRAFDAQGAGSYSNVIAGLNWIVANKKKYNIRVVNLSFGAPPQSNYWNDPLNQAVMTAWQAGIVVVASAGNTGPNPMTIGVPANVPYVITVGAMSDNFTPTNPADDKLASFSSTGPTYEGFVKPEVVAPGGHMVGSLSYQSYLASIGINTMTANESLFVMSGTSQAAAEV